MIANLFDNVYFVQALWCIIASVGFFYASINAYAAFKVVKRLRKTKLKSDEVEKRVSTSLRTTEVFRVCIQTIHLTIGFLSFTVPAAHLGGLPLKYQILGYAFRWGLVTSATLTTLQSVNLYRLRKFFEKQEKDVK